MKWSFNVYLYTFFIGFRKHGRTSETRTGQAMSEYESSGIFGKINDRKARAAMLQRAERHNPAGHTADDSLHLFRLAHVAISEIRPGIRAAGEKKLGRTELLLSLRRLLKNYTAFAASRAIAFRIAIENVIVSEAAAYCAILLDKNDLQLIWRGS